MRTKTSPARGSGMGTSWRTRSRAPRAKAASTGKRQSLGGLHPPPDVGVATAPYVKLDPNERPQMHPGGKKAGHPPVLSGRARITHHRAEAEGRLPRE